MITDLITDLEEAVSLARDVKKMFGKVREVYIPEFVFEEMRERGAKRVQFNRIRFIDPEVDGRGYEHIIKFRGYLYTWISAKKID